MFYINQFTIIGKFIRIKTINKVTYLYLKINSSKELKILINYGIKEKLIELCSINETLAVKGSISTNDSCDALLSATKIMFLTKKN